MLICTSTDSKEKDKDLKEMLKIDGKDMYMLYSNQSALGQNIY